MAFKFISFFYSNIVFAQAEPEQSVPIQTQEGRRVSLTPAEQAWLAEHPEIVLGAATDYPPMVIKNTDDTHIGVLVDLFEQVSRYFNSRILLHIEDS